MISSRQIKDADIMVKIDYIRQNEDLTVNRTHSFYDFIPIKDKFIDLNFRINGCMFIKLALENPLVSCKFLHFTVIIKDC